MKVLNLAPMCRFAINIEQLSAADVFCGEEQNGVERWQVRVFFNGVNDGYIIRCMSESDAEKLYNMLVDAMKELENSKS